MRMWAEQIQCLIQIKKVSAAYHSRKWQMILQEKRIELVKQIGIRWKLYKLSITPRCWIHQEQQINRYALPW